MKASIVVPTYRRPELLERCLRALVKQDAPFEFEIIVADNAGDPETLRVTTRIAAESNVVIRYEVAASHPGPAHARNIGWQAARGEIIALTDDDTIADKRWLAQGVRRFELDGSLAAVAGRTIVPLPDRPTDYALNESGLASAEFVTANCFCRRVALRAVDGFDENFTSAWREDSDLQFRMQKIGFRIGQAPEAIVVHPVRPVGFGESLRQQRKAMLDALLFKKHPDLFRRTIGFFAARYYVILAALLLSVVLFAAGFTEIAAGFLLIWVLLTAAFCWERLRRTTRAPAHVLEMIVTSALIPPAAIFWRVYGAIKFRVLFF